MKIIKPFMALAAFAIISAPSLGLTANPEGEMGACTIVAAMDPMVLLYLPPAPRIKTAIAGNRQAYLSWSKADGATGYKVERSTTKGGPYVTVRAGVNGRSLLA